MNKEAIHSFSTRITQATRSELLVILYEMILTEIEQAKQAYDEKEYGMYDRGLKKAYRYVNELMATLDYQYKISYDLLALYLYAGREIISAMMKKDPSLLEGAETVILKLLPGFEEVSRQDIGGPMMRNTQQLYAGLTYGKGTLNETYLDPNQAARGFKA